jgi:hypothetical protein
MTNRNRLEITPHVAIAHYMATFTTRTAHFIATFLDIQNYLTTFVAETVALESVDPKCKKQEAGTNHIIYSLVATKIRFFQLFLCIMVYYHVICLMNQNLSDYKIISVFSE